MMRISPVRTSVLGVLACLLGCDDLPKFHINVCDGGKCPGPTCRDGVMNNAETDVDCGGTRCDPCDVHAACLVLTDCASKNCDKNECIEPPSADFELSSTTLMPMQTVTAKSRAHEGSSPIQDISYDWDDGQGFEPSDHHTYTTGGSYLIRQRVTDQRGTVVITPLQAPMDNPEALVAIPLEVMDTFRQARFSNVDHSDSVRLSPDRMSVEQRGLDLGGVRSDEAIRPMSHVYYFEIERVTARTGNWGFGVATAEETLTNEVGHQSGSMGVLTLGGVFNNTMVGQPLANCTRTESFPVETKIFGFVVDYRAANPHVHLVVEGDGGTPSITNSCALMAVTDPLHIFYSGSRYVIGPQARINTGADTTNHPFHFSLAQLTTVLAAVSPSIAMADIVYGFGGTRALPANMPPTLNTMGDMSLALGKVVALKASSMDPEDGNLTEKITWLDVASQHYFPVEGVGGTFSFTPNAIGLHPLRVSVRDSVGNVTTKTVQVQVTGQLPQPDPVVLAVDALGGKDVILYNDDLAASFEGPGKYGIRANQGIAQGSFQYFEAHREQPSGNMGVGVIIGDGAINPYHFDDVPWSCSVNLTGSTWRNLIDLTVWSGMANDRYGFAVDYRGIHPIVYVMVGSGKRAVLESTLTLDDVWVPLYPMVYGNPQDGAGADISINFGAQPFQFDPRKLVPGGSDLQLGWGINGR
jgi:hypothetical protein